MIDLYNTVMANTATIVAILTALYALAEVIVRLTPTKQDDGALQRIGKVINKLFDILKVPNRLK